MNTYATEMITTAQARYLNGLLDAADAMLDRRQAVIGTDWAEARFAVRSQMLKVDELAKREASAAISTAKANNKILSDEIAALEDEHGIAPVETPEHQYVSEVGMYRVGDRIFKVLPSRNSDRYYAQELTGFHWEDKVPVADVEGANLKFRYVKGAMLLIGSEHRMPLAMERMFGQLTGACVDCGKLLTDPKSIEYGKGPVCSDNYKN